MKALFSYSLDGSSTSTLLLLLMTASNYLFLLPSTMAFAPLQYFEWGHSSIQLSRLSSPQCNRRLYSTALASDFAASTEVINNSDLANPCKIQVIGVGGGGGNAVNRMIETGIEGVEFWAINTDAQALSRSLAPNRLTIGRSITKGLGAGGKPEVGKAAARESERDLTSIVSGNDMVFITAGMGGGTGSGAAPIVAEAAKSAGCLTVGVVTRPFQFEGRKRAQQAESAINELKQNVDTLIIVSNDRLIRIVPEKTPVTEAFLVADDILRQGVVGITEIILKAGLVNVDFADVRTVMQNAGTALMGVGTGSGKNRATDAASAAISSPILDYPIQKAKRIVFNIVGPSNMGIQEVSKASEVIHENASSDANIIFGALIDPTMEDDISITVLACEFDDDKDDKEVIRTAAVADDERDVSYYKDRRARTKSPFGTEPLGDVEETTDKIRRGVPPPPTYPPPEGNKRKKGRWRRFLNRLFGPL